MAPSSAEKEKKSRWRSMLGGGRDAKDDDTSHLRPGPSPKDSAYGSERTTSDQLSATPQSSEPSETKVKQDPSTGNIVTTTITTTTTTTTVTTGKGEHIKTESTPTAEADATASIGDWGERTNTPAAANSRPVSEYTNEANNRQLDPQHNPRRNASQQAMNVRNPAELDAPVPGAASAEDGPALPAKSNRRISREMNMQPSPISEVTEPPVSPIGSPSQHNFSYPARTPPHQGQQPYQGQQSYEDQQPYPGQQSYQGQRPPQGQPAHQNQQPYQGQPAHQNQQPYQGQPAHQNQQPYQGQPPYQNRPSNTGQNIVPDGINRQGQRPGTFQNLKTAAAGIHGAGETLRGTLNSSIDRHVGHAPPERLAAHDQVISAGASEIETGRFYRGTEREQERSQGQGRVTGLLRKPIGEQ